MSQRLLPLDDLWRHDLASICWPTHDLPEVMFLALLGALAARVGGATVVTAAVRVTFFGGLAMALTARVGALFRVQV